MDDKLSKTLLLQIRTNTKNKKTSDTQENVCDTRAVSPSELIKTPDSCKVSTVSLDLLDKIASIKKNSEVDNLLLGSKLGLSSYLKPVDGIPQKDLNRDLLEFISKTERFIERVDLNKIPTKTSDLINDSGFIKQSELKTINGLSLIGSGNINIHGGFSSEQDPVFAESIAANITEEDVNTWNNKQNTLTFDQVPTENSNNPVISGGIKTYVDTSTNNIYEELNSKQNIISDLQDIREGAAAGATALQEETDPVFMQHVAHNITANQIASWNAKLNNISDLQTIRTGASLGATALQPSDVEDTIYENLTAPVTGGAIYEELQRIANNTPDNVVYVTLQYWADHYLTEDVFEQDNTHYIIVEDLSNTKNITHSVNGTSVPYILKFGKNCTLSAKEGCKLGGCTILLNDTYIDADLQYLFSVEGGYTTELMGTFANGKILVEWFGAKGGRGVLKPVEGSDTPSYKNKATSAQAARNSKAFRKALACAGNSVVYAQASMYLVGSTITLYGTANSYEVSPTKSVPNESNLTPLNFTKLFVEGDLVAFDDFVGAEVASLAGNTTIKIKEPSVLKITRPNAQIVVKGAIVVPEYAQDREINIITSDLSSTYTEDLLGKIYFKKTGGTVVHKGVTYYIYTLQEVFREYTLVSGVYTSKLSLREIGTVCTTDTHIDNYKSTDSTFGGLRGNTYKVGNTTYKKMPGMYGVTISAHGAHVEIGKIIKGSVRAGFWNLTEDGKVASYKYRKEVLHHGHCTGLCLQYANACNITIGLIEGFNDGVAFDGTYSFSYDSVQFNKFTIGNIGANYAIHVYAGAAHACLANQIKSGLTYFDACRWTLGGFEHFAYGASGEISTFMPTTSKSVYFLTESGDLNDKYTTHLHTLDFYIAPLRWYSTLIDVSGTCDCRFNMPGNTSGDTGRVILWIKGSDLQTYYNGKYELQLASGETASTAWFQVNSFVGTEALYGHHPYSYAQLAYLDKLNALIETGQGSSTSYGRIAWTSGTGYPFKSDSGNISRLAPYNGSTLVYNEWGYPYGNDYSYINFRKGSHKNVVVSGYRHYLCYDSVYNDTYSGSNELRNCQSGFAMFIDHTVKANYSESNPEALYEHGEGSWTVFNYKHPVFNIVRFDRQNDPRDYEDNTANENLRVMFVPDENTLSSLHIIDTVADIPSTEGEGYGLYLAISEVDTYSNYLGNYKPKRYKLYEKYRYRRVSIKGVDNSNTSSHKVGFDRIENIGWISNVYLPLWNLDSAISGSQQEFTVTEEILNLD